MSALPPVLTDRLRPGILGVVTGGRRVWVISFRTSGIRCKTVLQQLLPGDASE
jgi:hypothetical protein